MSDKLKSSEAGKWKAEGFRLSNMERYADAVKCYDKAITIDPVDDDAYFQKGIAYMNSDRTQNYQGLIPSS